MHSSDFPRVWGFHKYVHPNMRPQNNIIPLRNKRDQENPMWTAGGPACSLAKYSKLTREVGINTRP